MEQMKDILKKNRLTWMSLIRGRAIVDSRGVQLEYRYHTRRHVYIVFHKIFKRTFAGWGPSRVVSPLTRVALHRPSGRARDSVRSAFPVPSARLREQVVGRVSRASRLVGARAYGN